jgi:5-methylcytosine-specific restriction endonuclease McrA
MGINKQTRIKVWQKYNGHCAYCGKSIELKEMQVDHLEAKAFYPPMLDENYNRIGGNADKFENLMPSCRRCNHYKRAHDLEYFRYLIETLHERIQKDYLNKVALDYGIIQIYPFRGLFYFESYQTLKT